MAQGSTKIPFYPEFDFEQKNNVYVWWFERDFTQSRYGVTKKRGSNACTLIALLVALKCARGKIQLKLYDSEANPSLVIALAESIVEGNRIHDALYAAGELSHINLTIPEALNGGKSRLKGLTEWKSLIYLIDLGDSLYAQMKGGLRKWWASSLGKSLDYIFVVLISDNRSILFILQKSVETATLIDSHRHLDHGCVIAQVPIINLYELCHWHRLMLQHCYGSKPDCYELSFLYYQPTKIVKEDASRSDSSFSSLNLE